MRPYPLNLYLWSARSKVWSWRHLRHLTVSLFPWGVFAKSLATWSYVSAKASLIRVLQQVVVVLDVRWYELVVDYLSTLLNLLGFDGVVKFGLTVSKVATRTSFKELLEFVCQLWASCIFYHRLMPKVVPTARWELNEWHGAVELDRLHQRHAVILVSFLKLLL